MYLQRMAWIPDWYGSDIAWLALTKSSCTQHLATCWGLLLCVMVPQRQLWIWYSSLLSLCLWLFQMRQGLSRHALDLANILPCSCRPPKSFGHWHTNYSKPSILYIHLIHSCAGNQTVFHDSMSLIQTEQNPKVTFQSRHSNETTMDSYDGSGTVPFAEMILVLGVAFAVSRWNRGDLAMIQNTEQTRHRLPLSKGY